MPNVAIITCSDKGHAGAREDKAGPAIRHILEAHGYSVVEQILLPDDQARIEAAMKRLCDEVGVNLICTTGGTGFSTRDVTPEATLAVVERLCPGIPEAIRAYSLTITPRAMLSRAVAGIRGRTLIVNLPGSPKAVTECLEYAIDALGHGLDILLGKDAECARV
ncbi:MAG: MogA/MoaB family molybdenum cofactor biosynthesis protein [Desulfovibrio sp.]|nr:MogA/MoaB family molybdenum cofactor biosynthesis protein [Desulfovibrio sp.]